MKNECALCNGTGQDNDPGDANGGGRWLDEPCPCCRGKGWTVSDLEYRSETECPRCEGTGLSPNPYDEPRRDAAQSNRKDTHE